MTPGPPPPPAIFAWVSADRRLDLAVMERQLSDAVRLVSPLTDAFTFDGPATVMSVFASAFELLDDIDVVRVTGADRDWVLHGHNTLSGRNLEEVQWLHLDDAGQIDHIRLFIRPAPAAIALLARIGGPLAARRALAGTARAASRAAAPIAGVLDLVERHVMPRLTR